MGFDVESHLGAVDRSVSSPMRAGQPARAVTLSRTYATTVEDLWDAVTNGERIPRWFLPVTGELEPGGRYQLAGNAGGVITACKRPSYSRSPGSSATTSVGLRCDWRTMEPVVRGSHSPTPRSCRNTGARTALVRRASAGSWGSWDWRSISRNRPSQSLMKRLLPLRPMAMRSSQAAAMRGGKRRSRQEPTPTPHKPRHGARPRSTPASRPSPPDLPTAIDIRWPASRTSASTVR